MVVLMGMMHFSPLRCGRPTAWSGKQGAEANTRRNARDRPVVAQ
jgi:hypothetical protein